jgi:hypothetical protein
MDYVEQMYMMYGTIPSAEQTCAAVAGLDKSTYTAYLNDPRILEELKETRGVIVDPNAGGALTAEQLLCANAMLNLKDGRSERKKLSDLGISPAKYAAWRKDPGFQQYMRVRAENTLSEALPDTLLALTDVAARGDINGIKLHLEMTGRYNPKTEAQVNVEQIVSRVLDVIMRNVTDPLVLSKIADELTLVLPRPTTNVIPGGPPVAGVIEGQSVATLGF